MRDSIPVHRAVRSAGSPGFGVEEPVDQPVGAKQEKISRLKSHGSDLGIHELVASAQSSLERIAPGVLASFPFADLCVPKQPAYMGIVMADLLDSSLPRRENNRSGCLRYGRNTSIRE